MKKTVFVFLMFVMSALIFCGCAGSHRIRYDIEDPALLSDHLTKAYNQPAKACFEAAVTYFDDKGVSGVADVSNGTINTKRYPVWQGAIGNAYGAKLVVVEMKIALEVSGNENQCIVRATKLRFWQDEKEMTKITATERGYAKYWNPVFAGIKSNLEDLTTKYKSEDVLEIDVNSVTNITTALVLEDADTENTTIPVNTIEQGNTPADNSDVSEAEIRS